MTQETGIEAAWNSAAQGDLPQGSIPGFFDRVQPQHARYIATCAAGAFGTADHLPGACRAHQSRLRQLSDHRPGGAARFPSRSWGLKSNRGIEYTLGHYRQQVTGGQLLSSILAEGHLRDAFYLTTGRLQPTNN
jgi:hypothetical protein